MNKSSPPLALACADGTHFDKITVELCRAGNISQGDTLGGILNAKRGVPGAQMHSWLKRLRALNPHISNLNRIYPGERILIPQNLSEPVSDDAVWSNAFSRIPKALEFPHAGHTQLFLTTPGTTLDGIAKEMFAEGPHRTKRAVLIHNNPDLIACLETNRVPAKKNVDIRVSA